MTQIPAGTKFIGIKSNYPTSEKKSALANSYSEIYTIEDIAANSGVGPQGIQGPVGPQGPIGPVGPAGLTWQGQWTSGASYVENDAVGYNGASWFCILATSGTTNPSGDTTHWALLASQGAQGPIGETGAQGQIGPQGPAGTAVMPYKSYVAIVDISMGGIISTVLQNDFIGVTFDVSLVSQNTYIIRFTPSSNVLLATKSVVFTNSYADSQYLLTPIVKTVGAGGLKGVDITVRKYDGTVNSLSYNRLYVEIRNYD